MSMRSIFIPIHDPRFRYVILIDKYGKQPEPSFNQISLHRLRQLTIIRIQISEARIYQV